MRLQTDDVRLLEVKSRGELGNLGRPVVPTNAVPVRVSGSENEDGSSQAELLFYWVISSTSI
jgi:hypothetical protein